MTFPSPLARSRTTVFRPQCTHLTMTRVYNTDATCSSCQEPGQFGWLYQCTQDRNKIIEEKLSCMDFLDCAFRKSMNARKGSVGALQDRLTLLDELTPGQVACYRPDQIATVLRQREQLKNVIAEEELKKSNLALFGSTSPPSAFEVPMDDAYTGERLCRENDGCEYKVCPRCRPVCVDRAFLSLDAIANGEIPLTATAGFGFEALGGRPVIDRDVIKCINEHRPKANNRQMMNMLEEQIARMLGRHHKNQELRNVLRKTVFAPRPVRNLPIVKKIAAASQTQYEKEPALTNVAQRDDQEFASSRGSGLSGSPWPWVTAFENGNMARAPANQVQEQAPQQGLRATRIPRPSTPSSRSARRRLTDQLSFSAPYSPPPDEHPGRLLCSREDIGARAHSPRSRSSTTGSQGSGIGNNLAECSSIPPTIDDGVAMTEESIEAGVPDVVTQV